MKKSRIGIVILFAALALVAFVVMAIAVGVLMDTDKEASSLAGLLEFGNKIGVVTIEGTIVTADETLKQLRKFEKRSSIKAIVIRINSPGGTVAPAQELYREIGKIKNKKPVIASLETVAASAAYYIASNANEIVCSPGTITGSIGVIMMLPNLQQVIEKIGVNVNVVKAGKYKDIGSVVRPMTQEERTILESFAAEIHEQFIRDVAAGRKDKIGLEKLREIADGRFLSGEKAKEIGLVDTMGNLYDAVKSAAKAGGIKKEPELVYPKKKWGNLMNVFMESALSAFDRVAERSTVVQPTSPIVR